ncbi:MAG: VapC toxin family PIN domain ribonuclease [Legionellales bacterium]|nr:MAG: VapC toxin family PIN domain ribonuclease [Legionellales bacterium]
MFIIDTSLWIEYLKGKENTAVINLKQILANKWQFGITGIIYQEILQGASTKKDFEALRDYFSTQHFFVPKHAIETYQNAANIYFSCRKRGITIRSTMDCLIAQIAIEHQAILLHNDKDYLQIAKVVPELKL